MPFTPSSTELGHLHLDPTRAALLLVDFQEKLAAVMPPAEREICERNICLLIELARRLSIPVILSEQYPKGLGPTVATLAAAIAEPGVAVTRIEKLEFACTGNADFQ